LLNSKKFSPMRTGHILAIVNEALANTIRHAQAQNVEICAVDLGRQLQIKIKDDGIGIPLEPKVSYGLRNMRDRARLLNGDLQFANSRGTTITLTVPWVDQ
jgi:NarL family two-component system sensor histidine kinase LiaS